MQLQPDALSLADSSRQNGSSKRRRSFARTSGAVTASYSASVRTFVMMPSRFGFSLKGRSPHIFMPRCTRSIHLKPYSGAFAVAPAMRQPPNASTLRADPMNVFLLMSMVSLAFT